VIPKAITDMPDNADRITAPAAAWAHGPLRRKCACGNNAAGGSECAECAKRVMRRDDGHAAPGEVPASVESELARPGRALEREPRRLMERRFGHDFSSIRVHDDPSAAESARAVHAHAYTVGDHIVFGAGRYAPATRGGRHLLAHELAHTLQQRSAPARRQDKLEVAAPASAEEAVADRAADAVALGRQVPASALGRAPHALQRKDENEPPPNPFACDKPHQDSLAKATATAAQWLSATNKWFDDHLVLIKRRAPKDSLARKVGETLFAQLALLDKHFKFSDVVRKDWRGNFPDSANWEGFFKDFETLGRASYFIRNNFMRVRLGLPAHCQKECPKGKEGAEVLGSAPAGLGEYTIYTNCFDAQEEKTQAGVVLHEAFHSSFSSFYGDSYTFEKDYPGTDAVNNAESYTAFAAIVATGSNYRIIKLPETVITGGAGPTP
jgi:hypothetical protein